MSDPYGKADEQVAELGFLEVCQATLCLHRCHSNNPRSRYCKEMSRSLASASAPTDQVRRSASRGATVFHAVRNPWRSFALGVSTVALAAAGVTAVAIQPAWAAATGGSGASLAYTEVQAESAATNGTVIGPSYTQGQLADEASGRKAVTLQGTGKYVTFTTPVATNSIDFRYSIPDSSDGSVYTAPLSLYVNGTKQSDFTLTNAYSWYYGSYPFTNTPGGGQHHFYDEVHRLFGTTYPAGTTFKLEVDSEDTASSYTIDFADFEQVGAALTQPAGSVSVTSKGADASGVADSTSAFNAAIS